MTGEMSHKKSGKFPAQKNPRDLRSGWLNFARRMQAATARNTGVCVINVVVVVGPSGEPLHWTSPRMTPVEPANRADEFLRLFDDA